MKREPPIKFRTAAGIFLFTTLIVSMGFTVYRFMTAPDAPPDGGGFVKLKSDYALPLLQCALGLVIMFLPSFLGRRFSLAAPDHMTTLYFVFLYCAIYLGEVRDFYYRVPGWDTILHTFSGAMLGALGFSLVRILNGSSRVDLNLSPFFTAFFALCFSVSCGTLWEIYEFAADGILGSNMQKFMLQNGSELIGRAALTDTMKDIIVDFAGAAVVCAAGYFHIRPRKKLSR